MLQSEIQLTRWSSWGMERMGWQERPWSSKTWRHLSHPTKPLRRSECCFCVHWNISRNVFILPIVQAKYYNKAILIRINKDIDSKPFGHQLRANTQVIYWLASLIRLSTSLIAQVQVWLHQRTSSSPHSTRRCGERCDDQCPCPECSRERVWKDEGRPRDPEGHFPHRRQQGLSLKSNVIDDA